MSHDAPEYNDSQQNANPFAYHEAPGDLSDEKPFQKLWLSAKIKNISRWPAIAMIFPSLLTSWLLVISLLHAFSDPIDDETLLEFLWFLVLVVFTMVGIPWLITIGVTIGLFRGKLWAVNAGLIFSFLPILLALWMLLLFPEIVSLVLLLICLAYNFMFIRVKNAISRISPIGEKEERNAPNEFD